MVSDASPGVVQIVTPFGTGSGFIISPSEVGIGLRGGPGVLVITNAHVVLSYDTVDIRLFDGHSYEGRVVDIDESTDLALIALRASRDFEPVSLGNSYSVAVGEDVVAMGFPSGDTDIPLDSPTITRGIVSAKRVSASGVGLLQTDAAINPGNSGGPLLDRDGRVIGVNTSKVFESTDGRPVEGIGLAVAVNEVSHWFESIRNQLRSGPDSLPDPAPTPASLPDPTATFSTTAGTFVSVSAGERHTCGVKTDGSVECWGENSSGQATPSNGSFISVTAGDHHTCGLETDGSVDCWGSNVNFVDKFRGQAAPPDGTFVSVSTGSRHTCGVKTDGFVECWGSNGLGQSSPPDGTFVSVSAGTQHTCGVETDGSVDCWGYNYVVQALPPDGNFISVSSGFHYTCGVKTDGSIDCWGDDDRGQSSPPDGTFISVSAGGGHTCGVKTDGSIDCWGSNGIRNCDSVLQESCSEVPLGQATPPDGSFISVSAGGSHTCGVRIDGSVQCWGYGESGQLGKH